VGSFSLWVLLNIIFFCTIDLRFLKTFFGTKTAPQYTCEYFLTSEEDFQRWDAVFENRLIYTESIHERVKEWVEKNIVRWQRERPDWFNIEMVPDKLLPSNVLAAVGGVKRRRRSSVSVREIMGLTPARD